MSLTFEAIYEDSVLQLAELLPLQENEEVRMAVNHSTNRMEILQWQYQVIV